MSGEQDQGEGSARGPEWSGTVAWVELGSASPMETSERTHVLGRVVRAVRTDDHVCPVGITTVAVHFGPSARAVPLEVLGHRLALAVGTGDVAVGVAVPTPGEPVPLVAHRARSAARSSLRALTRCDGPLPSSAAVTVDDVAGAPGTGVHAPRVGVHRRTVRHYRGGRTGGGPEPSAGGGQPAPDLAGAVSGRSHLCVLVVDPMAGPGGQPGLAVQTALAVATRLGCRAASAVVSPDEPLTLTVDGDDVDLVVEVLDGAWVGRSPSWSDGAWGLPARLTTAYVDKGIPVLAVSAGAGAGALAACVAHGALALFDLGRLPDALHSLDELPPDEARQVAELVLPPRFRSLLELTAGERRVLFYLTEGWAAQDIADELVVSLTTVRSHIRSVLRKLEVRSQLAAVAIANSRDLDHPAVGTHP